MLNTKVDAAPAEGTAPVFERIGIVGLGLIGGSVALAVRQRWPGATLLGVDRGEVLERARSLCAIDVAASDLAALGDADLVLLAAPVRQNVALLSQLGGCIGRDCVVTDAGSTKREIVEQARRLPPHVTFVGGHPLGGSASSGVQHARADLFKERAWVLTPHDDRSAQAVEKLTTFVRGLGARPRVVTADEHDRVMAFVSHLPQLTASALMEVVGDAVDRGGLGLSGRGLVDSTRLAASRAEIWRDIVATNRDHVGDALDLLIERLTLLRGELDGDGISRLFERAGRWREELVKAAKGDA